MLDQYTVRLTVLKKISVQKKYKFLSSCNPYMRNTKSLNTFDITTNQSPRSFQHSSIKMQRRIMYNFAFFSLKTLFDVWDLICFFEEVDLELSMKPLLGLLSFALFLHYSLATNLLCLVYIWWLYESVSSP